MSSPALLRIPDGNAVAVEAHADDPIEAARQALAQLEQSVNRDNVAHLSVAVSIVTAFDDDPWEATAYALMAP